MKDPRIKELAHNLINYSVKLKAGEKLYIDNIEAPELTKALVEEAYKVGGLPYVTNTNAIIDSAVMTQLTKEQVEDLAKWESAKMSEMQAYIGIRGGRNIFESADVPSDKKKLYNELYMKPVHHDIRVNKTKWCILRYPTPSMAQMAGMSTESFEDFFFKVCNLDYQKMAKAMQPLEDLMNKTDKVRIVGEGTDISFSIKDIPAVKCCGDANIPDGEIYSAPVKDSINGVIQYNTPAVYQGFTFENIRLVFKDGKIVEAISNDDKRLNDILDTDDGARYVGEFAIGVHPYILKPMKDTLFDEKIYGSIHFTPGCCYEDADNGNQSAIHWDLVMIQTPEYGGGEIYFDDVLVRKDGIFVLPELECLNAENLK